jgi:dihydrofolate synthase / folylpolyglutamate synthase
LHCETIMQSLIQTALCLSDYPSVRDFLYGLRYHGAKYGLERMQAFSTALGNPHEALRCIHVAGTNGKGSTCAMLESIYRHQGLKTGLYTSPHLVRQGERIQVNREILSENEIVDYTKRMVQVLLHAYGDSIDQWPSFFEFMTAMAFLKFRDAGVDVAIIETGLGGRLDATNIITPELSIITSISFDHCQILGNDLASIAWEKAGIIKQGIPLVLGHLPEAAEMVIQGKALALAAPLHTVVKRWGSIENYPTTNLVGSYQRINAAMALLGVELLEKRIPLDLNTAKEALQDVSWAGRWEQRWLHGGKQSLILDASHNEEGARMLWENLDQYFKNASVKPTIAVGSLGEDRARHIMEAVCAHAEAVYLLQPNQPRALSTSDLRRLIPSSFQGFVVESTVDALFSADACHIPLKQDQTLLVTGSIYLIGEISDRIQNASPARQQLLQDVI